MYPQPYGNPYISPHAMQAANMNWASPDMVIGSGNMDLDMLTQAVQYEAASFPPGFGGLHHMTSSNEALMDRARGFYRGDSMPSQGRGPQGGEGGVPASAGGERSTGRRLLGAAATAGVAGAAMAGLAVIGGVNVWNPVGWACLAGAAILGFCL